MIIDERIDTDGTTVSASLEADGDRVRFASGDQSLTLPVPALARVLRRYGRELDPAVEPTGERLELGDCSLQGLRFHARVDAEGRDYLVWREPGRPPVAALSREIAAALEHLARRARDGGSR